MIPFPALTSVAPRVPFGKPGRSVNEFAISSGGDSASAKVSIPFQASPAVPQGQSPVTGSRPISEPRSTTMFLAPSHTPLGLLGSARQCPGA
jgi:hypothetical protein